MRIDIGKFGNSLVSRSAGREAALALQANVLRDIAPTESIELDFSGVLVLTPSWADEFFAVLRQHVGKQIHILPSQNSTVQLTLETIGETTAADKPVG